MKTGKLLLCAAASALIFAGCENNEENLGSPSISLDQTQISFDQQGGSSGINVTATRDWNAVTEADWITVEPASGTGASEAQTVTVTVLENDGTDRSATVTFAATNGMVSQDLTVTQTGPVAVDYTTIAEIRAMAPSDPNTSETVTLGDDVKVKVTVVSNHDVLQNLTSGANVYVQDGTAGIMIRFDGSAQDMNTFGKELEIDLSGQALGYYQTAMQVNNVPLANAVVLNDGAVSNVTPKEITAADLVSNAYESQYVAVQGVQVAERDLGKNFVEGNSYTSINFEDAEGNSFVVFSTSYSDILKETPVPEGSGVLKGIASINKSNPQIILTQVSDVEGLTEARFEGGSQDPVSGSIADVINADEDTPVQTEGVVMGIYKSGLVITDGTDNLLVYNRQSNYVAPDFEIGDRVSVSGTRAVYGELPQVAASYDDITLISSGNEVNYPEPVVIDASNIETFDKSCCTYIQYTGTLSISGNYYNVAIDGTSIKGSLSYPLDELDIKQYEGKVATYTGYYCGGTNDDFLNMLVVSATSDGETPEPGEPEEPEDPEDPDSPFSSNVEWTLVESAYDNTSSQPQNGTVNGEQVNRMLKLGASSEKGSAVITIPAGTASVEFYAVAWKGTTVTLTFEIEGLGRVGTQEIAGNDGAAGNPPYTITVTDDNHYVFNSPMILPSDMPVTVTTAEQGRVILWGIKAIPE